jgi:hypothetical protein
VRLALRRCSQEGEFEENFDSPSLNASRWIPSSMDGLFHCDKGTAHFVRARLPRAAQRRSRAAPSMGRALTVPRARPPVHHGHVSKLPDQPVAAVLPDRQRDGRDPDADTGVCLAAALLLLQQAPNASPAAQNPCNNPVHRNLCCAPHDGETVCANWTGAHAISAGASIARAFAPTKWRALCRRIHHKRLHY